MAFEHFDHQGLHRALGGGDLDEYVGAVRLALQRALECGHLATDAADAGEQLLPIAVHMGHERIVYPMGVSSQSVLS
ncbi:hypothetical protein GCM10007235_23340 [Pseudoxanthomonas indica]|nr:hypothetical protein GCM10007235_23340 [Pseudoxanthomonas indica]